VRQAGGNNVGLWPHGGTIDVFNTIVGHSVIASIAEGAPR